MGENCAHNKKKLELNEKFKKVESATKLAKDHCIGV
jgi:hypothetical protein